MNSVITAVAILSVLGAAFGLLLAFAAKMFAVEVDPREEAIVGILPGANCGGCGFPGCGGYASAVVAGKAPVNACSPGGASVAEQIAEIMGVTADASVKKVAQVLCSGGGCEINKYEYEGINDCLSAAAMTGGGPMECKYGCLGMGTCVSECPFDAIHMVGGVALVDYEACVACGKCVAICPKHIIQMVQKTTEQFVEIPCSSKDKGPLTRTACNDGCIGCTLCAKACPEDAITMDGPLAKIDYEKCTGCGLCAPKCPRKLITIDGRLPVIEEKGA